MIISITNVSYSAAQNIIKQKKVREMQQSLATRLRINAYHIIVSEFSTNKKLKSRIVFLRMCKSRLHIKSKKKKQYCNFLLRGH